MDVFKDEPARLTLELPWPPTANTYWRHPRRGVFAGKHLISRTGRAYRETVQSLAMAQRGVRGFKQPVHVSVALYLPDRRQRDIDNLNKALLDALSHAGVWADDALVDSLEIRRVRDQDGELVIYHEFNAQGKKTAAGKVVVEITPIQPGGQSHG